MITHRHIVAVFAWLPVGWIAGHALADPITGATYTYDLSTADVDPGGYPAYVHAHVAADDTDDESNLSAITSNGILTDGELGSTVDSDPVFGCCLFDNGTYAGFSGFPGVGLAPKPKVDIDLGGVYSLHSFTLHYLVEDQPSIYSPQPIPDGSGGNLFDALTVYGSTDGVNFTSLGFTNSFTPLYGLDGDVGSGAKEVRIATIDLTGATASHLSIDVRTPYSYIFLSEFIVDGASAGVTGDYNGNGGVDAADYTVWRDTLNSTTDLRANGDNQGPSMGVIDAADYAVWKMNFGQGGGGAVIAGASVPEPSAFAILAIAGGLIAVSRSW